MYRIKKTLYNKFSYWYNTKKDCWEGMRSNGTLLFHNEANLLKNKLAHFSNSECERFELEAE